VVLGGISYYTVKVCCFFGCIIWWCKAYAFVVCTGVGAGGVGWLVGCVVLVCFRCWGFGWLVVVCLVYI